jgi:hypothetical protein
MIIGPWLRGSRVVADLSLSGAVYDNQPLEAIPHHHITVANLDYLLGTTILHIFALWERLLHLLFPFAELPYGTDFCPTYCSTGLTDEGVARSFFLD